MNFSQIQTAFRAENWPKVIKLGEKMARSSDCPAKVLTFTAIAYHQTKAWDKAIIWLKRAIPAERELTAELWRFLGEAEKNRGHFAAAYYALTQAQRIVRRDGAGAAFVTNILAMKGNAAVQLGKVRRAARIFASAYDIAPDFDDKCRMYSSYLMTLNSLPVTETELFAAHRRYQSIFAAVKKYSPRVRRRHKKIRLGYISPDFHRHVMFFFFYQLAIAHDAEKFDLYAYYSDERRDKFTEMLQSCFTVWREVKKMRFAEMARQIYDDEIDILVDLAGHTSGSGLPVLAYKPAPVQISGLGYMATTGLDAADYIMGDKYVDPPDKQTETYLTETPFRFTGLFCYTGQSNLPSAINAPCRTVGYVTFACFNQYHKITDDMIVLWREILRLVPNSRLMLKNMSFEDEKIRCYAAERLRRLGISEGQTQLEPPSWDYMESYLRADVALDTYPYTGGGTTCDALYMGVPVVSLYGERRGSRFGLSILSAAGLGELAVDTAAAYVRKAVALAEDTEFLDALHRNLRPLMLRSTLMNTRQYIKEWENFLQNILPNA